MALAGLLVMGVAAINLTLLRLAGSIWDVITVRHDGDRMTELIGLFIGLVLLQGLCSMGHSYLTAWISQRIVADFHSKGEAESAAQAFEARFARGELAADALPEVMVRTSGPMGLSKLVAEAGLATSTSEATRKIQQGGVKVDRTKVTDIKTRIDASRGSVILEVGRKAVKVTFRG